MASRRSLTCVVAVFLLTACSATTHSSSARPNLDASGSPAAAGASPGVTAPAIGKGKGPGASGSAASGNSTNGNTANNTGSTSSSGTTQGVKTTGLHQGTIKIGFVAVTDATTYFATLGAHVADQGDSHGQINAMVNYINSHGGISGYKVNPVIEDYSAGSVSPSNEEALCKSFTEDNHVALVVLQGWGFESGKLCLAAHKTPFIDNSYFQLPENFFQETAPYYFAPGSLDRSSALRLEINGLNAQGFFKGATVGFSVYDFPSYHQMVKDVLIPSLAAIGIKSPHVYYIDTTNGESSIASSSQQAVLSFKGAGVNRVMFAMSDTDGTFMIAAENGGFHPRYGFTSSDVAQANANSGAVPLDQLSGALGVGYAPVNDVVDSQDPFPSHGTTEGLCMSIYSSAHLSFATRDNAKDALGYCDALLFMQAAGKHLTSTLTIPNMIQAMQSVGTYASALLYGNALINSHKQAGADYYRTYYWDASAKIFKFNSGVRPAGF